jgi:hypothetical protein
MARLYVLLFGLEILLAVLALISCLSAEEGELRALPRIVWVIIILLFPLLGAIVYFAAGRPVNATAKPGVWKSGGGFPEATRPRQVAPDDDPDFLRQIDHRNVDRQGHREDEDLLKRWEADLRRREDELRQRDGSDHDTPQRESGQRDLNGRNGTTHRPDDATPHDT